MENEEDTSPEPEENTVESDETEAAEETPEAPPSDPPRSNGMIWIVGSVVICLIFLAVGESMQPTISEPQLFLTPTGLVTSPLVHSENMEMKEAVELESIPFDGSFRPGKARVGWEADVGMKSGVKVIVKLALQVEGDGEPDIVRESEPVELDPMDGYQKLTTEFELDELSGKEKGPFKAWLTFVTEAESVKLRFDSEHGEMLLPVQDFEGVSSR